MPQIVVHHLDNSRSQRILWLLEELELDYELQTYARDPKTMRAPPELRQIHPLGKAPVVSLDGVVLAESGAILEALAQGTELAPTSGDAVRWVRYWLHFAEGSLATPLLVSLLMAKVEAAPVPFFLRPVVRRIAGQVNASYTDPDLERLLAFVEAHLAERPWFAGEAMTIADVQMSFPLEAAGARGFVGEAHPHVRAWLDRIHAREAYQRALERGGPYTLLT